MDAEDARVEFLSNWDKVRCLPGYCPLDYAIEQADRHLISFREDAVSIDTDGYRRFVTAAGWLQVTVGDRNILLPCDLLAEALGVRPMTITRYRQGAIANGFLRLVKKHRYNPKRRRGEATEFRFDVSRVPMLEEMAHQRCIKEFEAAK